MQIEAKILIYTLFNVNILALEDLLRWLAVLSMDQDRIDWLTNQSNPGKIYWHAPEGAGEHISIFCHELIDSATPFMLCTILTNDFVSYQFQNFLYHFINKFVFAYECRDSILYPTSMDIHHLKAT